MSEPSLRLVVRLLSVVNRLVDQAMRDNSQAIKLLHEHRSLLLEHPLGIDVFSFSFKVQIEAASHLAAQATKPAPRISIVQDRRKRVLSRVSVLPITLVRFLAADDVHAFAAENRITLSGNSQAISAWHALLRSLEIDWEAQLAEHFGDVPVAFLSARFREADTIRKRVRNSLMASTSEYLQQELALLPGKREAEALAHSIQEVSDQCNVLETRIQVLVDSTLENKT